MSLAGSVGKIHGLARAKGPRSKLEETLNLHIRSTIALPLPEREFVFAKPRRWRFDFAWPALKIAAECEGGIWTNGAHTRGKHFTSDCEKYNAAILLGWRVLRFTGDMITSGKAIKALETILSGAGHERDAKD